jgi:flagellar biosynthetic protein FliR
MLAEFLPANVFALLLVFSRVGSALMILPGIGDLYVPQRWRLLFAMAISGIVAVALGDALPQLPASVPALLALIFGEIVVGLFLGTVARLLIAALEVAGQIVSLQLGLSTAIIFNPSAAQQGAITSAFLMTLGTLVIFLTEAHHLMLRAVVDSYALFQPGAAIRLEGFAQAMSHIVAQSFRMGFELAAPLVVLGVVFYSALGLASRLMPQMQVFFITVPVQIIGGVLVFALTLTAVMHWFHEGFVEGLARWAMP